MPSPSSFIARLQAVLASPRVIALAVALAALVSLPVLYQGFLGDDHVLRGFLLGGPPWDQWAPRPLHLFSFYDGDPARTTSLVDHGFSPWWTDRSLRIMFFRPLSAFTHWVDFRLWPGVPALMHLQSLVWYLALVAAVGALYRRVLAPGWVAGFAVVVYALDHNHGSVVEWLANRNALVAATFGVLALVLHDRARREGKWALSLGAAACLALGLCGGEVALGAAGYLGAHALFLDRAPVRARLAGLLPYLAVLIVWLVIYRSGGYGARGSGLYVDPMNTPIAFVGAVARNLPLLFQTELGGFPPDTLVFLQDVPPLLFPLLAAALVALALPALWPLRAEPSARFFLAGALVSAVLVCGVFPAGRLLILPGIGLLGLVALVVEGVVDRTRAFLPGPQRWSALYVTVWLGAGHLVTSPLVFVASAHQLFILEHLVTRYGSALGDDPALVHQRLVIVNAPDTFFSYFILAQRLTTGRPAPERLLAMASGWRGMTLERRDARTLVVRPDGGFYRGGTEVLTRSLASPIPAGTRFPLTGLTVEVTRTSTEGVPAEAAFVFDTPLEDASLRWMEWKEPSLTPFVLPAVGETRRIEGQMPSP